MRLVVVVFLSVVCLGWMNPVLAVDPAIQTLQQNVAVAYQAPQASAEALVSLPTIYVLPGSFLYWFKHLVEQVQLAWTSDPAKRSQLLLDLSQQHLAEGYQAMKNGNWSSSIKALQDYQDRQQDLASQLKVLQDNHQNVQMMINRVKQQLDMQQALNNLAKTKAPAEDKQQISDLLQIRSNQTLALATSEGGALLGAETQRQAMPPAQASMSAAMQATGSGNEKK